MKNILHKTKVFVMSVASVGFILGIGMLTVVSAQQTDPFAKRYVPSAKKPTAPKPGTPGGTPVTPKPAKPLPPPVVAQKVPTVEERIAYYRRLRQDAVVNGTPIPKVTGFLTLDELLVSGIFRTPRGVSAVLEAKPISLSYTVYPGEKFFDGQLVAVEENYLVFRQVTKMSNGRFISAEVKRPLREFSIQEEVQGTAPVDTSGSKDSKSTESTVASKYEPAKPANIQSTSMTSPLDEMLSQPVESAAKDPKDPKAKKTDAKKEPKDPKAKKTDAKTEPKKPVRIASRKNLAQ
jgi:hypothetical protein